MAKSRVSGLDADTVAAAFASPEAADAAQSDFRRAAQLGVHSYPTLLALDGATVTVLANGTTSADEIDRRLTA